MHFNASRKSLSGGFWNTSDHLAKNHDLAQTAFSSLKHWNFGIRQKREFYDIELHIYSFFGVSVNQISDSAQTDVLMRDKFYYVGLWIKISDIKC